jgi:hypothetical protein
MSNPAMGLSSLTSLLATIHGIYPQARVTSGYRGPNDPLTQRNPRSMHAMGSPDDPRAVDVAPIPGVNFDQYVSSIKKAGVPVAQAFDEASHPFPWTTGPNWHIGTGAAPVTPRRKPTLASMAGGLPPMDGQSPVSLDAPQPMQQAPTSLADIAQPPSQIPTKGHSKLNLANILGVLGDSLMAYGGMQPQFGPGLARQQDEERQQGFDREKWQAELQARHQEALAKAAEPPQWLQDAQTYAGLPDPQRQMVGQYRDVVDPIIADVQGQDGSVIRRVFPRQIPPHPGTVEDGYVFLGGDPADPKSWRAK